MTKLWLYSLLLLLLWSEAVIGQGYVKKMKNVASHDNPGFPRAKRSLMTDPVKLALLKSILDDEGPKNTVNGFSLRGVDYDNNCFPDVDFTNLKAKNKYPRFEDCQSYYYFYNKEIGMFSSEIKYCLETEIFDPESGKCLFFGHGIIPENCWYTCHPRDLTKDIKLKLPRKPIDVTDLMKIVRSESDFVSFYLKNFYIELLQAYIKYTNKYASESYNIGDADSYIPTYDAVSRRLDSVVRDVTFRLFYKDVESRNARYSKEYESDEIVKKIKKLIRKDAPMIVEKFFDLENSAQTTKNAVFLDSSGIRQLKKNDKSSYRYGEPEGERFEMNSKYGNGIRKQISTTRKPKTDMKSKPSSSDPSILPSSKKGKAPNSEFTEL